MENINKILLHSMLKLTANNWQQILFLHAVVYLISVMVAE